MSAPTPAAGPLSWQGHYAGSVSRFLAYFIDLGVSSAAFALGLAGIIVRGGDSDRPLDKLEQVQHRRGRHLRRLAILLFWLFVGGKRPDVRNGGPRPSRGPRRTAQNSTRRAVLYARWFSRSAFSFSGWGCSAFWCSGSTALCMTSSQALRSSMRGTHVPPGSGSWPAAPNLVRAAVRSEASAAAETALAKLPGPHRRAAAHPACAWPGRMASRRPLHQLAAATHREAARPLSARSDGSLQGRTARRERAAQPAPRAGSRTPFP